MLNRKFGFIGGGQMARALARGWVDRQLVRPEQIAVHDPSAEAVRRFQEELAGASVLSDNAAVVAASDVIVLAIKPQQLADVAAGLPGGVGSQKLVVSVLAGVPLARLTAALGTERVVRVMPNTPALVGAGAAGYALGPGATADDDRLVESLLAAVGVAFRLEEKLLDAVTGLSGSGPAYVFLMIEALSDGGVRMGLPRSVATALAAQTVLGAAMMVQKTGQHPAVLKDQVASPGGTTIAGLEQLERLGVRGALMAAVEAATRRSIELGAAAPATERKDGESLQ